MKEPIRKLVLDFPASVMEALEQRKKDGKGTIKAQILLALRSTYGITPSANSSDKS